jgi:hypothetical protein
LGRVEAMPVSVNDSFLTELARDYASLSDLAYAKWVIKDGKWIPQGGILDFTDYTILWKDLLQKGYRFIDQKTNDNITGYAGTLFVNDKTGTTILANRRGKRVRS